MQNLFNAIVSDSAPAENATPLVFETREAWLKAAEHIMARWIEIEGYTYPANTRVSCGFPKSSKGRGTAIGQCWTNKVSGDDHYEMFICPSLADADFVASVLIHEMCHATVGIENGHNKVFGKLARALGMEGKLTATVAGEELKALIASQVVAKLGAYPHGALNARGGTATPPKKAKTYLIKCECDTCGHISYSTAKWISEALEQGGTMRCPNRECDGALNHDNGE